MQHKFAFGCDGMRDYSDVFCSPCNVLCSKFLVVHKSIGLCIWRFVMLGCLAKTGCTVHRRTPDTVQTQQSIRPFY